MAWCCVICPSVGRPNTRMTLGMHWITDNDNQTIRPILTQYWFRINIHLWEPADEEMCIITFSVYWPKNLILDVVVVSKFCIIYQFTVISNCYLLQFDAGGRQKVRGIWSQKVGASNWWPFGNEKIHKNIQGIGFPCVNSMLSVTKTCIGTFSFPSWSLDILTGLDVNWVISSLYGLNLLTFGNLPTQIIHKWTCSLYGQALSLTWLDSFM